MIGFWRRWTVIFPFPSSSCCARNLLLSRVVFRRQHRLFPVNVCPFEFFFFVSRLSVLLSCPPVDLIESCLSYFWYFCVLPCCFFSRDIIHGKKDLMQSEICWNENMRWKLRKDDCSGYSSTLSEFMKNIIQSWTVLCAPPATVEGEYGRGGGEHRSL